MKLLKYFILIICTIGSLVVHSQNVDSISTTQILPRADWLKEGKSQYAIYTIAPNGKLISFFIVDRQLKKVKRDEMEYWLAVQQYHGPNAVDIDSCLFLPGSLAPFEYFSDVQSEGHKESVTFSGKKILAEIRKKDSILTNDQSTRVMAYNAVMEQYIIQGLPLKNGYKVVIPFINPGAHSGKGLFFTQLEVMGEESLETAAGNILCWKLNFKNEKGNLVQWVSKKDQQLIKLIFSMSNGLKSVKTLITF
jgi:hypothetical protein